MYFVCSASGLVANSLTLLTFCFTAKAIGVTLFFVTFAEEFSFFFFILLCRLIDNRVGSFVGRHSIRVMKI